jgi:hypothetical protein
MLSRELFTPVLLGPSITAYDAEGAARKRQFHRDAQRFLQALATQLGLSSEQYDLRTNAGGMAVSGEVSLHADHLYVQLSKSPMGDVLYRWCDGRHDYCGAYNHALNFHELLDVDRQREFLTQCRRFAGLAHHQ